MFPTVDDEHRGEPGGVIVLVIVDLGDDESLPEVVP